MLTRRQLLRSLSAGFGLATTSSLLRSPVAQGQVAPVPPVGVVPLPAPQAPAPATIAPPPAAPISAAPPAGPSWLQTLRPIALWSGPDAEAVQLGTAARWDYLQLAGPQGKARLQVLVERSKNYAWVDALSVGPSGPPPPGWPGPDVAPPPEDLSVGWVASLGDAPLWADPEGTLLLGLVPPFTAFKQMEPQSGARLRVQDPYSGADAYLDAVNVGPIQQPSQIEVVGRWWGVMAVDGSNQRSAPSTTADILAQLPAGVPVVVSGWVGGEEVLNDNPTWARLRDGAFLYSSTLRPVALPSAPPPPEILRPNGRWIDLNLTQQIVAAYEGDKPAYVARVSTGRPGWETSTGVFSIGRRVENETMDSSSLLGLDAARASYRVENVRWTQYFTADGMALHENYWKPRDEFGIPSSHGCAGMVGEDAKVFWDFAALGTPILSHY